MKFESLERLQVWSVWTFGKVGLWKIFEVWYKVSKTLQFKLPNFGPDEVPNYKHSIVWTPDSIFKRDPNE